MVEPPKPLDLAVSILTLEPRQPERAISKSAIRIL